MSKYTAQSVPNTSSTFDVQAPDSSQRNRFSSFDDFTRYLLSITNDEIDRVLRDQHSASGGVTPAFWEVAVRQDSIAARVEECVVFDETAFTQVGKNKDEWKNKYYNSYASTLFGSYHHLVK